MDMKSGLEETLDDMKSGLEETLEVEPRIYFPAMGANQFSGNAVAAADFKSRARCSRTHRVGIRAVICFADTLTDPHPPAQR
jgi:hypothetical protein